MAATASLKKCSFALAAGVGVLNWYEGNMCVCQWGIVVLLCPEDIKAASDTSVEYTFSQMISLDFPDHPFLGCVLRDLRVLLTVSERRCGVFLSAPARPNGHSGEFNKTSLFTPYMAWSGLLSSLGSPIQPHLNVVNKKGLKIGIQHCNRMLRELHSKQWKCMVPKKLV